MNCIKVGELLSEYLEDSLNIKDKEIISHHISICNNCAREFKELKALLTDVSGLKKVTPPADFLESLHRRIEAPKGLERILEQIFNPWYIKIPFEIGIAGISVILIINIFNSFSPQKQTELAKLEWKPQAKAELTKPGLPKTETHQQILANLEKQKPSIKEASIVLVSKDIENDYNNIIGLITQSGGKIISSSKETLGFRGYAFRMDAYPEASAEKEAPVIVNFRIERLKLTALINKLKISNSLIVQPQEVTAGDKDDEVSLYLNISLENSTPKE